jgi:predicted nucleic acid-binding protein
VIQGGKVQLIEGPDGILVKPAPADPIEAACGFIAGDFSLSADLLAERRWGEFYYILQRRVGRDKTQEALSLLDQLPIAIFPVDDPLVREAAEIKAEHPIAYADAFCAALAQRHKGRVLTGDLEFKAVDKLVAVQWLKARN